MDISSLVKGTEWSVLTTIPPLSQAAPEDFVTYEMVTVEVVLSDAVLRPYLKGIVSLVIVVPLF